MFQHDGALAPCYGIGLQHFAEGGAEGGAGEGGNGLSGDFAADMHRYFGSSPRSDAGSAQTGERNGETRQDADETASAAEPEADDTAAASGQQSTDDPDAEFEQLIKGKFKDQFGRRTQGIINERFRKSKETEAALQKQLDGYRNMSAVLMDKYGLGDDATPEDLAEAIRGDNTNFSRQAMAAGMSVDAYREGFYTEQQQRAQQAQQQAEMEAQAAQNEAVQREQAIRQTYDQWTREAEELQKTFPNFDLAEELRSNEAFKKAVVAGIPVAQAYYGANFDKISSGLVAAASQDAARKAAQTVAANRARPAEGGQSAGTGIRTGAVDVNSLSGDQVLDIIKQVERGARITF